MPLFWGYEGNMYIAPLFLTLTSSLSHFIVIRHRLAYCLLSTCYGPSTRSSLRPQQEPQPQHRLPTCNPHSPPPHSSSLPGSRSLLEPDAIRMIANPALSIGISGRRSYTGGTQPAVPTWNIARASRTSPRVALESHLLETEEGTSEHDILGA